MAPAFARVPILQPCGHDLRRMAVSRSSRGLLRIPRGSDRVDCRRENATQCFSGRCLATCWPRRARRAFGLLGRTVSADGRGPLRHLVWHASDRRPGGYPGGAIRRRGCPDAHLTPTCRGGSRHRRGAAGVPADVAGRATWRRRGHRLPLLDSPVHGRSAGGRVFLGARRISRGRHAAVVRAGAMVAPRLAPAAYRGLRFGRRSGLVPPECHRPGACGSGPMGHLEPLPHRTGRAPSFTACRVASAPGQRRDAVA